MNMEVGFFAYPEFPKSCGDSIESAVEQINLSRVCEIQTWKSMNFSGKDGVEVICGYIDSASFCCADLTELNPNVLFEVGYAIARNKRLWLVADTSFEDFKHQLQSLPFLNAIGHSPYTNASNIINEFHKSTPYQTLNDTIWNKEIQPVIESSSVGTLLYLKPLVEDQAALLVGQVIRNSRIRTIVDDPRETQAQPLSWYAQQIHNAAGILCHFTGPKRTGAKLHNAKLALVCGLAYGLGKKMVMLTEDNFLAPFDYRMLLHHYTKSQEAQEVVKNWIPEVIRESTRIIQENQSKKEIQDFQQGLTALQELKFGEYLAENEPSLENYFIETPEYEEAKNGINRIFVGRKGTGKTANLLRLAADLRRDPNNLVATFNPEGYQMDGLVSVLKRYANTSDKSYLIETLWKFLLYTELANTLYDEIKEEDTNSWSQAEKELILLIGSEDSDLRQEFAIRLERTVQKILCSQPPSTNGSQQNAITETIHKEILGSLRRILPQLLADRSLAILADNLDKAWDPFVHDKAELQSVCKILLGLLTSVRNLNLDFDKETKEKRLKKGLKTSIAAFLRADIYHHLLEVTPEPDKLQPVKLKWNDPELLTRVIDERLLSSAGMKWSSSSANTVWSKFFPADIEGKAVKQYILDSILPRPRDIVCLVKFAVSNAVIRRHLKVWPVDLTDAQKQYSEFAISTITAEYPEFGSKLQYEFMGCDLIMTEKEVCSRIQKVGIEEIDALAVIDNLVLLSFLGLETDKDEFRFAEDPGELKRLNALSQNYLNKSKQEKRFKVHRAFVAYLEVQQT